MNKDSEMLGSYRTRFMIRSIIYDQEMKGSMKVGKVTHQLGQRENLTIRGQLLYRVKI